MWLFKVNSLYTFIYIQIYCCGEKKETKLKNWFFFSFFCVPHTKCTPAVLEFSNILLLTQHTHLSACRTFAAHKMMFTSKPSYFFLQQWLTKRKPNIVDIQPTAHCDVTPIKNLHIFFVCFHYMTNWGKREQFALDYYTTEIKLSTRNTTFFSIGLQFMVIKFEASPWLKLFSNVHKCDRILAIWLMIFFKESFLYVQIEIGEEKKNCSFLLIPSQSQ